MQKNSYRIFVIDPSTIIVSGLSTVINQYPEFAVSGSFPDTNKAIERINPKNADLVIVNPLLVDYHKRLSIKQLFPQIRVIALIYNYVENDVLTQFDSIIQIGDEPQKVYRTLKACVKMPEQEGLHPEAEELSDREKEILVSVAKGFMNKEIANLFHLSIHTVMSHRKNISRKTGIKSVSGFVVYALLNNLIEEHEIQ